MRNAVQKLEKELAPYFPILNYTYRFGKGGDFAFMPNDEIDTKSAMDHYSRRFNKPIPTRVSEGTMKEEEERSRTLRTNVRSKTFKQKMVEKFFGEKRLRITKR